jgi:hypothetical protein
MKCRLRRILVMSVAGLLFSATTHGQADLRTVIESRLKAANLPVFTTVCPVDTDPITARVFREYGAMYVTAPPSVVPSKCVVQSEAELADVRKVMKYRSEMITNVLVTLQEKAMDALLAAQAVAARRGLVFTPLDGTIASARSFDDTVSLWRSRFDPALAYWVQKGRITPADADAARRAPLREQVEKALTWEGQGIYFGSDRARSILSSVAVPGGSQHNFMLAIDLVEYGNPMVRQIMAEHGWFQTVRGDLTHFTYLGLKESELPRNGLRTVYFTKQKFWIPNLNDDR